LFYRGSGSYFALGDTDAGTTPIRSLKITEKILDDASEKILDKDKKKYS